jgi:hypothetical protein
MKLNILDEMLQLWEDGKLEQVWSSVSKLNKEDFAFTIAWMTAIISDDGQVKLSQWLVWLETKSDKS